jgi:hypothetical protein
MYKYESLKPVKGIFEKGSGGRGRIMEGINQIGVLYIYIYMSQ